MFSTPSHTDGSSLTLDPRLDLTARSTDPLLNPASTGLDWNRTSSLAFHQSTAAVTFAANSSLEPTPDPPTSSLSSLWPDQFTSFSIADASGDATRNTVFQGGALALSYTIQGLNDISTVHLEVWQGDRIISTLGNWTGQLSRTGEIIDLTPITALTAGTYQIRAVAESAIGNTIFSATESLQILPWSQVNGTFAAETFDYTAAASTGAVLLGRGGTDTLNLVNVARANVLGLNGLRLSEFNPWTNSTANQAIFGGTAFDTLTLTDGRELYFQGIENLRFTDGSLELQGRPDDPFFAQQWNLHVSDVEGAWRFTQGSGNVLLVSLDSGILTAPGAQGGIVDIATDRLITDSTDDDNGQAYGHGHSAISMMVSKANNQSGIAGINWNSNVYVNDIYGSGWEWRNNRWEKQSGVTLQQAIQDVIDYARANHQRVVFQTGIQGESWLTNGGSQAQLEQLIQANSDIALFAVAAGNGYRDIDDRRVYPQDISFSSGTTMGVFSGGVSRLQTTHDNVIAVGALRPGTRSNQWYRSGEGVTTVNGLVNATSVSLADYSNYGNSLTLVAATDAPAMDKLGNVNYFGGTSAANPDLAGIASLVWSANSTLTAGQVRQILTETAMDLGTPGRDATYGQGLVNADAAVRRAVAIGRNAALANLHTGSSLLR